MAQVGQMEAKTKGFGSNIGSFLKKGALVGGVALVGLGAAALKIGGEFDKAYDTIKTGTGATGEALEDLKDTFKNVFKRVPTDMGSASKAVADLNTRTGATGKTLEKMSKTVIELSRLTETDLETNIKSLTRVFGDWAVDTDDSSAAMDRLFKISQATGPTVQEIGDLMVKFGAPLRQFGFGFDEAAVLMGKWQKEGVNTELVMGSLRIAIGIFAREGIPLREGLDDTINKIKELGPGAEATALAMEKFGARAGPDMAAAILEGKFEIEGLLETLGDTEGAVLDTAEATESWTEKFTKLKNEVLVALEPLLLGLFDRLTELATVIEERTIPALKAWWQTHGPEIIGVLDAMEEGVLLLKDATLAFGNWILDNKLALVTAIAAVGIAFAWINPGSLVLVGLATAITLIGTMRQDVRKLPLPLLEVREQIDKLTLGVLYFDEAMLHIIDYFPADVLGLKTPVSDLREHINDLKANVERDMEEIDQAVIKANRIWETESHTMAENAAFLRSHTNNVSTGFVDVGSTLAAETPPMLGKFQRIIDRIKGIPTDRKVTLQVDDAVYYTKIGKAERVLADVPPGKKVTISVDGESFWTEARNINAYIQSLRDAQVKFDVTQILQRAANYQTGAWEVPHNIVAQLHAGEMVIPREPAEVIRDAIMPPSAPAAVGNRASSSSIDPSALAAAVASALQGMTVMMDGRVVGNLISERIGGDTFMLSRGG